MKYSWILFILLTSCTTTTNEQVCCTSDADCARLGGISPRGCPDGFACVNLLCEPAMCATDSECSSDRPMCEPDTKTCSSCTESPQCERFTNSPICDTMAGSCRGCQLDSECDSDVCDIDTGRCLAESEVLYASNNGVDTATCTKVQPCSISRALTVSIADPASSTIRMLPGTYSTSLSISSSAVSLIGTGAVLQGAIGSKILTVTGTASVTIRGLALDLTRGQLECTGTGSQPSLILSDTIVTTPSRNGIIATNCSAILRRVQLISNHSETGYGPLYIRDLSSLDADSLFIRGMDPSAVTVIDVTGATATSRITNSVFDNATVKFEVPLGAQSSMIMAFNTLYVPSASGPGSIINCLLDIDWTLEGNIIVVSQGEAIIGDRCSLSGNIVFPQTSTLPPSNMIADPLFVDPANHDLRVRAGSPAIDAAPAATTLRPDHDFLGTPRPQGAQLDIGAYEFQP